MDNITRQQIKTKPTNQLVTKNTHERKKCVQLPPSTSKKNTPKNAIGDNLNCIKIDSARFRIPFNHVKVIAKDFMTRVGTFVYDTGEILDDRHIPTKKLSQSDDGVGVSYAYVRQVKSFNDIRGYITVGVSSKLLKQNYFDGINLGNIQQIVDYINSDGVIQVSLEAVLNSFYADVDLCINRYIKELLEGSQSQPQTDHLNVVNIVKLLHLMTNRTLPQDTALPKPHLDESNNIGIQWSKRDLVGRSYHSKQFLKVYAKLIELNSDKGSKRFTDTYLRSSGLNNYNPMYFFRYETTIKNKAHFKTYGVDITTVKDLLELDLYKFGPQFFERPAAFYLNSEQTLQLPKEKNHITPTDKLLLAFIAVMIERHVPDYLQVPKPNQIDIAVNKIIALTFTKEESKQCKSNQRLRLKKLAKGCMQSHMRKLEKTRIQVLKDLRILKCSVLNYDVQH